MIEKRIKRFEKVVNEYLLYTKWDAVNAFLINDIIFVTWLRPRSPGKGDEGIYLDYTAREFPVVDVNKRIRSYKDKIVVEKAKLKEKEDEGAL